MLTAVFQSASAMQPLHSGALNPDLNFLMLVVCDGQSVQVIEYRCDARKTEPEA